MNIIQVSASLNLLRVVGSMTKRQATVNILCEDLQQQVFARSFLIKHGFEPGQIRLVPLPDGQGSGEQYVRKLYLEEVKAQRSMSTYRSVSLVVIIDADTGTTTERLNQLDSIGGKFIT
jgi:hypothetical protein